MIPVDPTGPRMRCRRQKQKAVNVRRMANADLGDNRRSPAMANEDSPLDTKVLDRFHNGISLHSRAVIASKTGATAVAGSVNEHTMMTVKTLL